MSYKNYDYTRQRIVKRSNAGSITSITPIYNEEDNKYNRFFLLVNKLKPLSAEFPENKLVAEIFNVPPIQYQNLIDDIGLGDEFYFYDSKGYFTYQININCLIMVHKMI